ncbi:hypothetical protein ACR6A7_13800 [Pantoea sp. RRHST58]|uniref:hypothetical protein n=1 Tax=Pantoea sp. RRHST58 TaxID=3425183 RepID=UPI003DA003D2
MKLFSLLFACGCLCGCVDLGQVSLHPQTTTGYFAAHRFEVEQCLETTALNQRLRLEADDPLPGGVDRFNLLNAQSEAVAWIEVAKFSHHETSAQFYYAPDRPAIAQAVATMIARCGSVGS